MSKITLKGVFSGNPFADHPELREVWPAQRSQHVEVDEMAAAISVILILVGSYISQHVLHWW